MWAKVLDVAPHNSRAHFSLGQAYRAQGDLDAARRCYERCLRLDPDFARAQGALGYVLLRQGDLPRAAEHLRRAIELQPDYLHALINYGNLLVRQHRSRKPSCYYRRALVVAPTNAAAHTNLGSALLKSGRPRAAIAAYRRALRADPEAGRGEGPAGLGLGDDQGRQLAERRRGGTFGRRGASGIWRGYARPQDVLAAAYAEVGRFDDACRAAAKGLELAAADGPKEDMESLRARLALYRNRKPYREKSSADPEPSVSKVPDDVS